MKDYIYVGMIWSSAGLAVLAFGSDTTRAFVVGATGALAGAVIVGAALIASAIEKRK